LGQKIDEKKLLEEAVNKISDKSNGWNENKQILVAKKQCECQEKLDNLRREQASKNRQLRDIIESETYSQSVACGKYKGTATEIALSVKEKQGKYGWFKDAPPLIL
jgi:hypothetical protein